MSFEIFTLFKLLQRTQHLKKNILSYQLSLSEKLTYLFFVLLLQKMIVRS